MKNIVLHDNVVKANEIIGLDAVKALKRRGFEASMYAAQKRVIMYDNSLPHHVYMANGRAVGGFGSPG